MTGENETSAEPPHTRITPTLPAPRTGLERQVVSFLHEFGVHDAATIARFCEERPAIVESTLRLLVASGYITRTTLPGTFTLAYTSTGAWDPYIGPRANESQDKAGE